MRRLKILYYWLFKQKFNVSFKELLQFLLKPSMKSIARQYILSISKSDFYEIRFNEIIYPLYWPVQFPVEGVQQVTAETFDKNDWHYYRKKYTEIQPGEILLDVGTAEGLFPLAVIDLCQKVMMIEPNGFFIHSLTKTFKSFGKKAEIFHTAVGNRNGEISLDGNSLSGHISEYPTEGSKIPIRRIDDLIQEKITYLKADIEGYELEMLKGAVETIRKYKPTIAITSYHTLNNHREIIDFIKNIVPEYQYYTKGIFHMQCKPVMIHFYLPYENK